MWRRTAGFWGPAGFGIAAFVAGRSQPGYSHRTNHVSGLASRGERSATIMVPGFLVLAGAQSVLPVPTPALERIARLAAATTLAAGVVRVSHPRCPQPGFDPDATVSDLGHAAASVATFVLWTAMPVVAAHEEGLPEWYRRAARASAVPTMAAFVAAGITARLDSSSKGVAQRAFLLLAFSFLAITALVPRTSVTRALRDGRQRAATYQERP